MRTTRLAASALAAPFLLALAACPGDRPPQPVIGAETEPDPVITDATRQLPLQGLAGTGVTGEVFITPFPDSVVFRVEVSDAAPENTLPVRVLTGSCESPGAEVAVLEAVLTGVLGNGRSQRGLHAEPHRLLDGMHVVAVYAQAARPGQDLPLACAAIPAMR
jgi:hypothetical protein